MQTTLTLIVRNLFLIILFALPLLANASLPESSNVPGGIAVISISSASGSVDAPQSWLDDQPVLVTTDHGQWYAIVGLSLEMTPGPHELRVKIGDVMETHEFMVNPKDYPVQHITLKDKSKVELSASDLVRAESDIVAITNLKHHWRTAKNTDLALILPAKGKIGGRFGVRRFFNDEPRSPHAGLDVVVKRNTPIKSSAQGIVLSTAEYFFNGKTIFVDHGNGLITMYCHLDRIDVKPGVLVNKGQRLGLSGMTGRASGPHLHWSVVLNGVMVDPELFVPAEQMH